VTEPAADLEDAGRARKAFAAFLALHFLLWTALPALLYANLPLDLIEASVYGREWQLGYDKLPPLPWWMVEIAHRLFGVDAAYYAMAQLCVVVAFALVFLTAGPLVGAWRALVAILIIDGLHFFQFTAAKFNHDVIQLPLWAAAGYAFHAGLRHGQRWHWVLLGLAVGAALWAKYLVVMLAAPLMLFMLLDPDARKALARSGPWLALLVAMIVMAPHVYWLVSNDFLPFADVETRAAPARGLLDHVVRPFAFVLAQLLYMLPCLLIAVPLLWRSKTAASPPAADAFDRRIVTLLAFGPAAAVVAASAVSGRGTIAMWGYPLWLFLGLWIVLNAKAALDAARGKWIAGLWAGVTACFALAFVADYVVLPGIDHRSRAVLFPGAELGREITARFRAATDSPLVYVIGSMWDAGNVAHYSPERPQPRVLIDGLPRRAPWIDFADLAAKGAVLVWTQSDPLIVPEAFERIAPGAQLGEPFELRFHRGGDMVHVGWAILPPTRLAKLTPPP